MSQCRGHFRVQTTQYASQTVASVAELARVPSKLIPFALELKSIPVLQSFT
jgi:hypothetical protein